MSASNGLTSYLTRKLRDGWELNLLKTVKLPFSNEIHTKSYFTLQQLTKIELENNQLWHSIALALLSGANKWHNCDFFLMVLRLFHFFFLLLLLFFLFCIILPLCSPSTRGQLLFWKPWDVNKIRNKNHPHQEKKNKNKNWFTFKSLKQNNSLR